MTDIDRSEGAVERAAGRGMVTGTIIGLVLLPAMVTIMMLYGGAAFAPAIGVGLFAGFWGGPGIGGMMGAILGAVRAKDAIGALESSSSDVAGTGSAPSTPDHDEVRHQTAA